MGHKLPYEFRKYNRNRTQLKNIFKETQRILELINLENFFPGENILDELLPTLTYDKINHCLENFPAIVVFGQNNNAKASFINKLLSGEVLPSSPGQWRWVKLGYSQINHINLSLGLEYVVVDSLKSNLESWTTVPIEDLQESESEDPSCPSVLEVKLNRQELKDGVQIFVAPESGAVPILEKGIFKILPVLLYALDESPLSGENIQQLRLLREAYPYDPILFITTQENYDQWLQQLTGLLDLIGVWLDPVDFVLSSEDPERILNFVQARLDENLVEASHSLNDVQTTSLRKFILSAFDMAREIQITPKRIQYAQQKENELYANLVNVVSANQEELTELIQRTIQEMRDEVLAAPDNNFNFFDARYNAECSEGNSEEVQRQVLARLGERVAKELVQSVKCLQETFFGTLQRCLLSLEKSCDQGCPLSASDSLKQILSAAYDLEIRNSSPSLLHSFLERLRQLFRSIKLPWTSGGATQVLSCSWRKKVTLDVLQSLSAAKLARAISTQFRDKVRQSHEAFQAALRSLENHYSGKLERTEEQRIAIRKYHAPRLAKLALESTSMSDMVRFGVPVQGREIGRGQYGVVFACDSWGGAPGPCAIKSVVPPDERHWNDLAMEVYYTRSIPDHARIVRLRGSVIDQTYGGGSYGSAGAAVLLITDRLNRDLYAGLQAGLNWPARIQIAIDVLEGIRYLHSQGLVHRDIKLKNVLLDGDNRAKLTDLGFCITEAMMSGSIVGTPVHMAPELLSGHYDSSVDIYAFGILFWYICAGQVRFPYAFEQFHNKEQLWTSVKRGIRPERLVSFDDECWNLMEQCWSGVPSKRPLLGAILPVLQSIQQKAENRGKLEAFTDSNDVTVTTRNNALALLNPNNQRGSIVNPPRKFFGSRNSLFSNLANIFHTNAYLKRFFQSDDF